MNHTDRASFRIAHINGAECVSTGELIRALGIRLSEQEITDISGVKPYFKSQSGIYWQRKSLPIIAAKVASHLALRAAYLQDMANIEAERTIDLVARQGS